MTRRPTPYAPAFIIAALLALLVVESRADGIFGDGFEWDLCLSIAGHPDVEPAGFDGELRQWGGRGGLFGPQAIYPFTQASEVYPVGSWTLGNSTYSGSQSTRGRYLSVPITGDGTSYKFEWIQAKPSGIYHYAPARPTDFHYVTMSPCKGDFRRTTAFIPADPRDTTLVQQCRNHVIAETGLYYGPSGFGRCKIQDGQTMYLNIIWVDASQGAPLDPLSTGCRDTATAMCETSWKHLSDGL